MREIAEKHGIEWKPTKNYIRDRLPYLMNYYLLAPGRLPHGDEDGVGGWVRELFTWQAVWKSAESIFYGVLGYGSI